MHVKVGKLFLFVHTALADWSVQNSPSVYKQKQPSEYKPARKRPTQ